MSKEGKKGQLSVIVIVAVLIVLGVGGYFALRNNISDQNQNSEFSNVFQYYEQCIQQYAQTGLAIAASQGGSIGETEYIAGSNYAPFGNSLDVAGANVPYWFTISGNGVVEENTPNQEDVERELSNYVQTRLENCNLEEFAQQGVETSIIPGEVRATIASDGVIFEVDSSVTASNENSSATKAGFETSIKSDFGSLFNDALKVYEKEQNELFLENYSFDVLRLYAPVDGVEVQCSPKVWTVQSVFSDLKAGLTANLESIKFDNSNDNDYFTVNSDVKNNVQIFYNPVWPSRFEVYGNEGNLLVANPIGNQQGLAALGFCYVPYHFVYDMMFPVLVRINSETEFFQFPMVIVIDKNMPRNSVLSDINLDEQNVSNLCAAATQPIRVSVRSSEGAVRNASVSYSCFDQACSVGITNNNGIVTGVVPACLNGFVNVETDGYSSAEVLFSSHNSSEVEIRISKQYNVRLNLSVDGKNSEALSFISFQGENGVKQGVIPESRFVNLASGFYNVTVYQYGNASIRIPATTTRQCLEVSAGGIRGIFGATEEQCYDISLPETIIDRALTAGGQGEVFIPEDLLQTGNVVVKVKSLPKPTGVESLETNYALFETQGVDIEYE